MLYTTRSYATHEHVPSSTGKTSSTSKPFKVDERFFDLEFLAATRDFPVQQTVERCLREFHVLSILKLIRQILHCSNQVLNHIRDFMSYACVNSCLMASRNAQKRGPYREHLRDASKMPCLMKRQTQGLIADESESRPSVEAEA